MTSDLVLWAVYRSLDDATGIGGPGSHGLGADERLARWRAAGVTDDALLDALRTLYLRNASQRRPGEPTVILNGKGIRKSYAKINGLIVDALKATCGDSLEDVRDRALLLFLWDLVWSREEREISSVITADIGGPWPERLSPPAAQALEDWVERAGIRQGALFREVDGDGRLGETLTPEMVKRIENERAVRARLATWEPVLWVDWEEVEPDLKRPKKPDAKGMDIVKRVRHLLVLDGPPPLPAPPSSPPSLLPSPGSP